MWRAFSDTPDLTPYRAEPPRTRLDMINPPRPGQAALFDRIDSGEDDLMNDVLWRAIMKTDPPPPVRSYQPVSPV
ncbi:MAG: hypothetical protein FJW39_01365 [Acidobacteria bacterium]|nr:hypothetical protein [Acidobacteriota bacterium]